MTKNHIFESWDITARDHDDLKRSWAHDPCWDLEDHGLNQEHTEALRLWAKEFNEIFARLLREDKVAKMTAIGLLDNEPLYNHLVSLERRLCAAEGGRYDDGLYDITWEAVREADRLEADRLAA